MENQIISELAALESLHKIKILYSVESGSRAWGFASTDSDWDVRFIYMHDPDWYLSIEDNKDSIDEILPNNIDLSGWELRKTLKLFRKSNPPLLEWLRSPIVYKEKYSVAENLRQLSEYYFNPKSCMYHYLHMAEGNVKDYLQKDTVKLKKYFYMLRPVLACQYIEKTGVMAPMEFQLLVDSQVTDEKLKTEIQNLLLRKMNGEELNEEPKITIINDFIEERIFYYNNYLKNFDINNQPDVKKLNELFRGALNEVYYNLPSSQRFS